jgi:uncharacterized OB-fold protein
LTASDHDSGPALSSAVGADEDSLQWWATLGEGTLTLPKCLKNGHVFFPPAPTCPECGSGNVGRIEACGLGTIYSWVVVHHSFDPKFVEQTPYTIAAVDLEEGPRLIGRLRGQASDGLAVRVAVRFENSIPSVEFEPS